jgi:hypothetical protein
VVIDDIWLRSGGNNDMRLCDIRVLDNVHNHSDHCVVECSVSVKGYVNSNHNCDVNTDVYSYVWSYDAKLNYYDTCIELQNFLLWFEDNLVSQSCGTYCLNANHIRLIDVAYDRLVNVLLLLVVHTMQKSIIIMLVVRIG